MGPGYLLDCHLSRRPRFICGHGGNDEKRSVVRGRHCHVCSDPGHGGVLRRLLIIEFRDPFYRNSCYSGCHTVMACRSIAPSSQRELISSIFDS